MPVCDRRSLIPLWEKATRIVLYTQVSISTISSVAQVNTNVVVLNLVGSNSKHQAKLFIVIGSLSQQGMQG